VGAGAVARRDDRGGVVVHLHGRAGRADPPGRSGRRADPGQHPPGAGAPQAVRGGLAVEHGLRRRPALARLGQQLPGAAEDPGRRPALPRRKLYQADIITEYRTQVLGELGSDDDRPELLLQHDDQTSEDFQAQVNRAIGYGWDFEWDGDGALAESDRLCVDLGTSAIQCYFDPSYGKVKYQDVPHLNGKPLLTQEEAMQAVASSFIGGPQVTHQADQGRPDLLAPALRDEPASAPRGDAREVFPLGVRRLPGAALRRCKAIYGDTTRNLEEDRDISSSLGDAAVGPNASSYATGQRAQEHAARPRLAVHLLRAAERLRVRRGASSTSPATR
jgi:hypothetical protein